MYNTNERDNKMSKEYDTTEHLTVLSELNVLYQLANETDAKIDVKNQELKKIKELQKKKEDNDDEIPF
jgi:hypothetical protein